MQGAGRSVCHQGVVTRSAADCHLRCPHANPPAGSLMGHQLQSDLPLFVASAKHSSNSARTPCKFGTDSYFSNSTICSVTTHSVSSLLWLFHFAGEYPPSVSCSASAILYSFKSSTLLTQIIALNSSGSKVHAPNTQSLTTSL